jgi:hypothetical protein
MIAVMMYHGHLRVSPTLQPIGLWWAAGKNHPAWMQFDGCKMKDAVSHLRAAGWHGNEHRFSDLGREPKRGDCVDHDENHRARRGLTVKSCG